MRKYVLKRLAISVATLLTILFILFLMLRLMPGSPFNDEKLTKDQLAILYEKYGLDKPVPVQFVKYVGHMVTGDLGVSYAISKNTPITLLLKNRLPVSVRIGFQAVSFGALIGFLLGLLAAFKRGTVMDTLCTVISVLGVSLPSYVFALALSYTLGFKIKWFPMLYQTSRGFFSSVLPTIALSMFTLASISRFTRGEMIEVLDSDYMMFVRSKGITGARLVFRHALRNALIPIITVLAPLIVGLMTGSLVVEKIFSIPGVGSLMIASIQGNDYNVTIAIAFIYSAMYIGIMLLLDILYGLIDPRIRLARD
ncbi:MAG: ABC transporter permease [Fusobacteriaceae bacterium]|jgi:oligopeptide transport system permease protein|nr:ABC transporter permease [Fusobacteriaceae bacterium]